MLHPDDEQLVLREQSIPGLASLLDDTKACELFNNSFPDLGIRSASCHYLRYKPATNCIATFTLQSSQGTKLAHAIAHLRTAQDKLSKARQAGSSNDSLRVLLPETSLVVSLFPCDDELPSLRQLATPEEQHTFLKKLSPRSESLHVATLCTLRYKPERRYVGRLDDSDGVPRAILKLHSKREYEQARRSAKSLHSLSGVTPAEVLGHSDRHRALLLKWVPGSSLATSLTSSAHIARSVMEELGRLLAVVHSHAKVKLPHGEVAQLVKSLNDLPSALMALYPDLAERSQVLASQVATLCGHINRPVVALHGDLNLDQIVVGERVSLIDFDNAMLGHAERDLGNLLAHFEEESLGGSLSQDVSEELFESLLKEYTRAGGSFDLGVIRVYAAVSLLSMVQEPFRKRIPDWRRQADRMLQRASSLFEGVRPPKSTARHSTKPSSGIVVGDSLNLTEDAALATLSHAIDPSEVQAVLLPILRESFQDESIGISSLRVIRHKFGRRCLIEYKCHSPARGGDFRVLGKISAKPKHNSSIQLQLNLWNSGFHYESVDHISVSRPLGVVEQWRMWLQEAVPGQNCWNELTECCSSTLASQIVASLKKLQEARIPTDRVHGISDELELLQERLLRVATNATGSRKRIQRLADSCHALGDSIPDAEFVATHRDFYPDQVVVSGQRLFLLDFDLYCFSHSGLDLGNFCGHLIERGIREPELARGYSERLFQLSVKFRQTGGQQEWKAVEAFTTLTLARHVYLCTLFPERESFMLSILEECERRLDSQLQSAYWVDADFASWRESALSTT